MSIRSKLRVRSRIRSAVYRIRPPKPQPLILTYHRIAFEPVDYFRLAVSPDHFEEQLEVLRRTRRPRPLCQFVKELVAGTLPTNAVALTFDDGYVDNLLAGKPRLEAADVPATVFLITGYVDDPGRLWWDELAKLILFGKGPQSAEIVIREETLRFDLGDEAPASKDGTTRGSLLTKRHAALWRLRQALRRLDQEERRGLMAKLRSMFAWDGGTDVVRAMTSEEVRKLIKGGLVMIGAHTVTHPVLPELTSPCCDQEVARSKTACEAMVGAPVTSFAYPYGEFDGRARDAVMNAGFTFACGTRKAPATSGSDIFALPRIHVPDVGGAAFEQVLHAASAMKG
jgi:peptidoglycan/xylan/chitin deacetylase (PgdA/CDA1 family)